MFNLEHHRRKGAVCFAVPVAGAAMSQGLFRRGIEQDRNVDPLKKIAVAMGPFHHQHPGMGKIHGFIPQRMEFPPHPLKGKDCGPGLEAGNQAVYFFEVYFGGRA